MLANGLGLLGGHALRTGCRRTDGCTRGRRAARARVRRRRDRPGLAAAAGGRQRAAAAAVGVVGPARRRRRARGRRRRRPRPGGASSARPAYVLDEARLPRPGRRLPRRLRGGLRRPVRRRRRLLRGQGVPVHRGRPLGRRGRARPRRLHAAASSPSRCAAGVPAERIGLHGNNKSDAELDRALAAGVGRIVVDSLEEIDRVADVAGRARRPGAGAAAGHRRRRGPHARVHRHRPRGPEVRPLARRRASRPRRCGARWPAPSCELLRAAQPHRLADLRHRRLRGRGAPACSGCTRQVAARARRRAARARPRRRLRHRLHQRARPAATPKALADGHGRDRARASAAASGSPCRGSRVEPGRAIAGPSTFTLYTVGTVKDVAARPRRARAGTSPSTAA